MSDRHYQQLCRHVEDNVGSHEAFPSNWSVRFHYGSKNARFPVAAKVDEHLLTVLINSPIIIPPGCRRSIAEAVLRANYRLALGRFDLDWETGNLEFCASSLIVTELDDPFMASLISISISTFDRFLPAMLSVVYANTLPEEAISRVECRRK